MSNTVNNRQPIAAGNWKMNLDISGGRELATGLNNALAGKSLNCQVIVCPANLSLGAVSATLNSPAGKSPVKLGGQNLYPAESGAFTGENSAAGLKELGASYVILGHSERRTIFSEKDDFINQKNQFALDQGLTPIFCIGETLEEREAGKVEAVLEKQVTAGMKEISAPNAVKMVLAYEPVWAIGTGKTATPGDAQAAHLFIRQLLGKLYDESTAAQIRILYGGSVKPDNITELISQPDIDGGLVGGASLKLDSFMGIIEGIDESAA